MLTATLTPHILRTNTPPVGLWERVCGIVKGLLGRRAGALNGTDSNGWTALSCAPESGLTPVMNIILGTEDIEPTTRPHSTNRQIGPKKVSSNNAHSKFLARTTISYSYW